MKRVVSITTSQENIGLHHFSRTNPNRIQMLGQGISLNFLYYLRFFSPAKYVDSVIAMILSSTENTPHQANDSNRLSVRWAWPTYGSPIKMNAIERTRHVDVSTGKSIIGIQKIETKPDNATQQLFAIDRLN